MSSTDWDPTQPDQLVRLKSNPGKQGTTTGKVRQSGSRILVQVEFSVAERTYLSKKLLEPVNSQGNIIALILQGRFGGPEDLRRILTLEKIKGQLTNIFYSMESSQTDFYAHQFKPILKFLNSTHGRLLIADEVGLGKTIEAIYIWKELQVREEARRLLIICPAMLRQKWQDDLHQRFNITADIIDSKGLLERLQSSLNAPKSHAFVCITSLEGMRQGVGNKANWEDSENQSLKAKLLRILDQNPVAEAPAILDLVIIDEAHYLRNPETAGHRLGRLIRDAARHLLLLTATPIQTDNANLFNLLRLVDQDVFENKFVFKSLSEANRPIIEALRYLWGNPINIQLAQQQVEIALQSHYFADNEVLHRVHNHLSQNILSEEERIALGYKLEKVSLLGEYITRSRKRDVLPNRLKRKPQTLSVRFSDLEQDIYQRISQQIRHLCRGQQGAALFTLITRQRQMASCMVAALKTWKSKGILDEFWDAEEYAWEDFGSNEITLWSRENVPESLSSALNLSDIDLQLLTQQDSKYNQLLEFLRGTVAKEPEAKFVIFAYFRNTLSYLQERLQADGIDSCLIMGGMGDAKWDTVDRFREPSGPKVLLSSEVGSEGIDLQHCRFVVNYDLPWNPMRVEQRIGRLDRLGQKAESIAVVNFSLIDTIEERVLERLYDRIHIFEHSLGDLEAILGPMTDKLLVEFFQQGLTREEQEERMSQTADAILKQQELEGELESEAVNFHAFSDHILGAIQNSREQGRWLQPDEVRTFVFDYLLRYYPGTFLERRDGEAEIFDIDLSEDARIDFRVFLRHHRNATSTRLYSNRVACFFDPKIAKAMGKNNELLEPTHPLIQWIRFRYESGEATFYPLSAIRLKPRGEDLLPAPYIFCVQRWTFQGLKTESRIVYRMLRCADGQICPEGLSERVVMQAVQYGDPQINTPNLLGDLNLVVDGFQVCEAALNVDFGDGCEEFEIENKNRCDIQLRSAEAFAHRKSENLEERIAQLRASEDFSKQKIIPALTGQRRKVESDLEVQRKLIDQKRETSFQQVDLAGGVIFLVD